MAIEGITDSEFALLSRIWEKGDPTCRDLAEFLYGKVTDAKLASVQKLIERLESKGFVVRDRDVRPHRFRAQVTRDAFLSDRLRGLADRLCDGAIIPLMTTLLRPESNITREQGDELRRLIDELWPDEPDPDSTDHPSR